MKELSTSMQKIGEEVMKKMQEEQAKQAPAGGESQKGQEGNVRDAETEPITEEENKEGEEPKTE